MKTILSILIFALSATALRALPVVPLLISQKSIAGAGQSGTNPASVSGMVLWVDATNACTNVSGSTPSNNGVVNGWADQSGNNFTLVAQNANGPRYITAGGPNGGPCVTFSNAMTSAALTNRSGASTYPQPNTFFIVMTKPQFDGCTLNTYSGQTTQINDSSGNLHFFANGSDFNGSAVTLPVESWFILTVVYNGASSLIRTNGAQAATMASVGTGTCPGLTLGNYFNYSAACQNKFASVIWYTNLTDTATLNGIEHWLGAEFGITTQ